MLGQQPQDGGPGADLDVVRMRTDDEECGADQERPKVRRRIPVMPAPALARRPTAADPCR